MQENVGGWDRNIRFILGAGSIAAAFVAPLPKTLRLGLLGIGAGELITASTRYCPVNRALRINTAHGDLTRIGDVIAKAVRAAVPA